MTPHQRQHQADAKAGSNGGTGFIDSALNGRSFGAFVMYGRAVPGQYVTDFVCIFVRLKTYQLFNFSFLGNMIHF